MEAIESTYLYQHGGLLAVVLTAALIIIGTIVVSQFLVFILHRALKRTTKGEVGGSIIANLIRVAVWIFGISTILKFCFNYNASVLWGALGVGGIAISLGLQNTLSNLIGGLQVSLSREITLGDWVSVGNVTGKVNDITWRVMKVQDSSGNNYIIPNSVLNTTPVKVLPAYATITLPLVFADSVDLDEVQSKVPQIAYQQLEKNGFLFKGKKPELSIDGTAINSVNATLAIYTRYECSSMSIRECVIPPIVSYLRSSGAIAAYSN